MRLDFCPYNLIFKKPAGTSRGVLTEKITCFLRLYDERDESQFGIGEAAVFPGLSPEADERYFVVGDESLRDGCDYCVQCVFRLNLRESRFF